MSKQSFTSLHFSDFNFSWRHWWTTRTKWIFHYISTAFECTVTTYMYVLLVRSIHRKPSVTFLAIPRTKFHLQCKIWDKFFVRYYPLEKSRNALEINWQHRALRKNWMTDRAGTQRHYRGQWCQLSVKKVFDNLFKRGFWMINSR